MARRCWIYLSLSRNVARQDTTKQSCPLRSSNRDSGAGLGDEVIWQGLSGSRSSLQRRSSSEKLGQWRMQLKCRCKAVVKLFKTHRMRTSWTYNLDTSPANSKTRGWWSSARSRLIWGDFAFSTKLTRLFFRWLYMRRIRLDRSSFQETSF